MFKKHWVIVSLLAALALFVGGFVLVGENTRTADPRGIVPVAQVQTVNFVGTWNQLKGVDGTSMTATITPDGKISIEMHSDPISGSYWQGSFNTTSVTGASSVQITSTSDGDPQLAKPGTKVFTYANGVLSFEFSILGHTNTIELQRSAE